MGNKIIRLFGEKVELQVEEDLTSEDAGTFAKDLQYCQRVYHFSVRAPFPIMRAMNGIKQDSKSTGYRPGFSNPEPKASRRFRHYTAAQVEIWPAPTQSVFQYTKVR